jgi:hypothetical protein
MFLSFLQHVQTSVVFSLFTADMDVKQPELIGRNHAGMNHCSFPIEKVFFLQTFAQEQTFD